MIASVLLMDISVSETLVLVILRHVVTSERTSAAQVDFVNVTQLYVNLSKSVVITISAYVILKNVRKVKLAKTGSVCVILKLAMKQMVLVIKMEINVYLVMI